MFPGEDCKWPGEIPNCLSLTYLKLLLMKFKKFGKIFDFVLNLALKFEIYQLNIFAREDKRPFW